MPRDWELQVELATKGDYKMVGDFGMCLIFFVLVDSILIKQLNFGGDCIHGILY